LSYLISNFFQFLPIFIAGVFFLLGLTKSKKGLYLLVFLIPFEGIGLRGVGASGFCVVGYFLGYYYAKVRLNENIWKNIHYRKYILLIIVSIIISLFILAIRQDYSDLTLGYGVTSIVGPLIRYTVNISAAIMLYILISNEVKTHQDILNYIWVFILSLSYMFITWIGSFVYHLNLPSFLRTRYSGGVITYSYLDRFAGYVGEYGLLSEYFVFIIAFSILLILSSQKKLVRKLIPFIAISISIPMAISTGTRAFLIIIFLFAIIFVSLISFKKKVRLGKRLLIISSIFIVYLFIQNQIQGSYLLERVTESVEIGQSIRYTHDADRFLNRPYITEFINTLETVGLFGVGPVNIVGVKGNNLCWHSLYYDMLIKFGVFGFLIYIFFYLRLLRDLSKNLKLRDSSQNFLPIILFSLFIPLLIGEYARSYQNRTSFMLMYWFLFAIIACVNEIKPNLLLNITNNKKSLEM